MMEVVAALIDEQFGTMYVFGRDGSVYRAGSDGVWVERFPVPRSHREHELRVEQLEKSSKEGPERGETL